MPEITGLRSSVYLSIDAQHLADAAGLDGVGLDVALLGEDAGDLVLEPRGGQLHVVVVGLEAVADPREQIGDRDRIGAHQLLFVSPGM